MSLRKALMATPQKHLEVETYVHLGIAVQVEIDYDNGKISLMQGRKQVKNWVFAQRGLEYMDGWRNILDAMKYAIGEAEKKLAKHTGEKEKQLARRDLELTKEVRNMARSLLPRI